MSPTIFTRFSLLALFALSSAACSITSTDSGSSAPQGPVAATPLQGKIEGTAFVAKTALAHNDGSDGTRKSIDIYDADVKCSDFGNTPKTEVLISVAWTAGSSKDFNLSFSGGGQTATFVVDKGGSPDNIIASTGRVEIIDAPTDVGATGTMRLRAVAGDDQVEGEIPVQICE